MKLLLRMPPKRRRKGLTDYRKRLKLVKSGLPRLVIRRTNRYIIVQLTRSKAGGDNTVITITSKKLAEYGWRGSFKNITAAYLTGFLAGKLALSKGIEEAIVDIGLHSAVYGSRLFAAVKGAIDAGLEIPAGEEVFPPEERIRGEHIKNYFEQLEEQPDRIQFKEADPEFYKRLPEIFEEIKNKIVEKFGGDGEE